jgi:hypothetical protein
MTAPAVEQVASALLYEGYLLYPYRRSAIKNRHRFNFGVVYPEEHAGRQAGTDACEMRTECLVEEDGDGRLEVTVRFLHLFARAPDSPGEPEWHEAVEREIPVRSVALADLLAGARRVPFDLPAGSALPGRQHGLTGRVDLAAEPAGEGVTRLRIAIVNLTPLAPGDASDRDELLLRSLVSAHTILRVTGGEFVSLIDPPAGLKAAATACRNLGTWPVLAGEEGVRTTMLSSPIIVYDYPSVAPESPGDFFDGTEMDEMLSLRILTLTDEEKRAMGAADERARRLLERTERLGQADLMRLHGVLRQIRALEEAP